MIGTGRGEQQRFGLGIPPVLVAAEQELADLLGAVASAGFARDQSVDAARFKGFGKRADLG
jgi:hypothetical protein